MPLTLHEAFVPTARQILGAMPGIIAKAEAHCEEKGLDASELIEARLAETMWNLPWHVRACWVHSGFAINLYETGVFSPDFTDLPQDWDAMRALIADALAQLDAVTPDYLESIADKPVDFQLGGATAILMSHGKTAAPVFSSQPLLAVASCGMYDLTFVERARLPESQLEGPEYHTETRNASSENRMRYVG